MAEPEPADVPACILYSDGARSVTYQLLVFMVCELNAVLCLYSSVAGFQVTVLGGSMSCLVTRTLMVLDSGRVIYLT